LINNRQGGRRRGRGGGGRAPNSGSNPGNRQDNRQRGNAAQLLEKYRQLARDSQMQGDRVQTELYLQFADHYFRVLNENRARFEEHRPSRDNDYGDEDEGEDDNVSADADEENAQQAEYDQQRSRRYREQREDAPRSQRDDGQRSQRDANQRDANQRDANQRDDGPQRNGEARFEEGGPRRRRGRRDFNGDEAQPQSDDSGSDSRIALDSLPPAIAAPVNDAGDGDDETPRPRRRTRRPRGEDGDITPAAA